MIGSRKRGLRGLRCLRGLRGLRCLCFHWRRFPSRCLQEFTVIDWEVQDVQEVGDFRLPMLVLSPIIKVEKICSDWKSSIYKMFKRFCFHFHIACFLSDKSTQPLNPYTFKPAKRLKPLKPPTPTLPPKGEGRWNTKARRHRHEVFFINQKSQKGKYFQHSLKHRDFFMSPRWGCV